MPGVVSADLFEHAIPMLPFLSTFASQKRFQCNSSPVRQVQNLMIITMMFVMLLFANDVFDVGYYVVCYENETLVQKKDNKMCIENMKPSTEPQTPEYLTLCVGILLGLMFLINRLWEFYFQNWIRQHVDEVIYEMNDSLYRAMMVKIGENAHQQTERIRIYKEPLNLHIEDISPMDCGKRRCIVVCFFIKNVAYCAVLIAHACILSRMVTNYEDEKQECQLENRYLVCTIPEYHTLWWIKITAIFCSIFSCIIIIFIMCRALCNSKCRYDSFFKVYNTNVIPHYNYTSLTLQSPSSAWGVILLYLKENDFLLMHYGYLKSICTLNKTPDNNESSPLLSSHKGLNLLKRMKQQVLTDYFNRDLSDGSQFQGEPDGSQN
ncbi:uncharacterized protein LOC121288320 [Carcharodon carcharias]|uniref:uncharacterized protein LOC121288320 n=1 Tax=Carcharodon carcharias TaxID=13397 RepID=UPI001B7DD939|nr:uncharacterized protein LOC121288320 [Carcharodon carcharias]